MTYRPLLSFFLLCFLAFASDATAQKKGTASALAAPSCADLLAGEPFEALSPPGRNRLLSLRPAPKTQDKSSRGG